MSGRSARQSVRRRARGRRGGGRRGRLFAALDLGTNNCRLLIAAPQAGGFRVVDGYSRIVRLGEGLASTGRLSDAAMDRTMAALKVCADKIAAWPVHAARCIATQACRGSENGAAFLARVREEIGLEFAVISPREEAELAVLGCAGLIDETAETALIVDIGGGSTEISWVRGGAEPGELLEWASLPFGVVTLADQWGDALEQADGYARVVDAVRQSLGDFGGDAMRKSFAERGAHFVGASGTVTSLAAMWLAFPRYQRSTVDGVWLSVADTRGTIDAMRQVSRAERARNPCIGPDRADLVTGGAAILEAIFDAWPAERIRVADRGLREGVLSRLIAEANVQDAAQRAAR